MTTYKDIIPTDEEFKAIKDLYKEIRELNKELIVPNTFYNKFILIYDRFYVMNKYLTDFGDTIDKDMAYRCEQCYRKAFKEELKQFNGLCVRCDSRKNGIQ